MSKFKANGSFGQNPLTERKHPLLFETVLDTIFPYLTFEEVKSSRLVCKTWNEIGIRILGRKKLKPIKFVDIKYEDFALLRKEFENSPVPSPKIKLFQGFQITWAEVVKIVIRGYQNFLPTFKPNQLVISGNDLFPDVFLSRIFRPVLTTLTDLNLEIKWGVISTNDFFILNDLANLGMTLKKLRLNIFKNEPDEYKIWDQQLTLKQSQTLCQNLGALLQSQSPFLQKLELTFSCRISENGNLEVIQLPAFPRLHSLILEIEIKLKMDYSYFHFFAPFDMTEKIPNLVYLNIFDKLLDIILDKCIAQTKGHPLKMLTIIANKFTKISKFGNGFFKKLNICFPNIEDFNCQVPIKDRGPKFPWVESLKNLTLKTYYHLPPKVYILHLKKLENLHYIIRDGTEVQIWISRGEEIDDLIESLKNHQLKLPYLKSLCYTFEDLDYSPESNFEEMDRIQEALLPSFWAILKFE